MFKISSFISINHYKNWSFIIYRALNNNILAILYLFLSKPFSHINYNKSLRMKGNLKKNALLFICITQLKSDGSI